MQWKTNIDIPSMVKKFVEQLKHDNSNGSIFSLGAQYFPDSSTVRYAYMPTTGFLESIALMDEAQEKEYKSDRVYCGKNENDVTFAIYMRRKNDCRTV